MSAIRAPAAEPVASVFSCATTKRVCCLVDDSPPSREALCWTVARMMKPGDELHLLHVTAYEAVQDEDRQKIMDKAVAEAQSALTEGTAHAHLVVAGVSSGTSGVGEEIVSFVERHGIDVLVVGSRGMGSVKRATLNMVGMGSVSEYCLTHLRCPVLVVKDPVTAARRRRSGSLDLVHSLSATLGNVFKHKSSSATASPLASPQSSLPMEAVATQT